VAKSADRRSRGGAPRERVDRHRAILDAASTVFAKQGYAQASVEDIAAQAGVAKATVYSHFRDKEKLLLSAIAVDAERASARNLDAVAQLSLGAGELRTTLEDTASRLLECYCDERSQALRRLLAAEVLQFPDLLDAVRSDNTERVVLALADRLARLNLSGALRTPDPHLAAEQFVSLLTGPIEIRSRFGTKSLPRKARGEVARQAVNTFLQAFAPQSPAP
jgi:TetR/AcrR family transcriptional regulator, mexJK operon transcriptional repressor